MVIWSSPMSSGQNNFQVCTAHTKNRYLHAVCSTRLFGAMSKRVFAIGQGIVILNESFDKLSSPLFRKLVTHLRLAPFGIHHAQVFFPSVNTCLMICSRIISRCFCFNKVLIVRWHKSSQKLCTCEKCRKALRRPDIWIRHDFPGVKLTRLLLAYRL